MKNEFNHPGLAATIILISLFLIIVWTCNAQVYSSWASAQVRHAVEVEKPEVQYDTIRTSTPFHVEIRNTFIYKDFTVEVVRKMERINLWVYTGSSIFILRPDDEYAILEKLIPLTR